jgi:two-component system, OmpR family, KDP operon response regulator KdpE
MRMSPNTILVIDDEPQIRRFVSAGLQLHGYAVREAINGAAGLEAIEYARPDLVILDIGLPDMSGIEVLQTMRSWSNAPVIVLSVELDEEQKVRLLKGGADDYMTKPFGIAELAARCEAALRRYHKAADKAPVVRIGPITFDPAARVITLDGKQISLTRKEFQLLRALASHLGLVVTHDQLMKDIWGDSAPDTQYLRTLVRQLRQKLEIDPSQPKLLVSESGVGYRLQEQGAELVKEATGLK